ncbi:class I SAM-dependent methyltransferase [Halobacteria archaeon AArc-curdl1]|uniref:Class I SAM-dependent methyltransferase n=1 Tax=Natronosalvus hydrolyticus TaxID=2979988 RepID=A0AAP3E703_9EURY|nr:class I SAM-dependent methyltransferase [Halobacteria archaeon AArc-curdl1]
MTKELSHPVFAAIYDPATWLAERTILRPHREYLAQDLDGRVLDLGTGTGAMFPFFAEEAASNQAIEFYAIDPDPHMRKRARSRTEKLDLDVEIRSARAESLPYPSDSFDVVIASMVFCTIPDVETAIGEVVRVLKPGGEFRFLEHVAADGWQSRLQKAIAPVWRRIAGGCHLTRRTPTVFVQPRSLDVIEITRLRTGIPPVRPFVRGRLRHRRSFQNHRQDLQK